MIIGISYHYIRKNFQAPHPSIFGMTPSAFESQIELLSQTGDFIGSRDLVAALNGGSLPERAFVITFDDGLREQYENALPILDRLNLPAIFFVSTSPLEQEHICNVHKLHIIRSKLAPDKFENELERFFAQEDIEIEKRSDSFYTSRRKYDDLKSARIKYILNFDMTEKLRSAFLGTLFSRFVNDDEKESARELYMSVDQLRDLASRGFLGSHGHSHASLAELPKSEARLDIQKSRDLLERWTGYAPATFSYPYGNIHSCAPPTDRLVADCGFSAAFTMERAGNAGLDNPFYLARFADSDMPGGNHAAYESDKVFESVPEAIWYR